MEWLLYLTSYFGGKLKMMQKIIRLLPRATIFVDAFCGSGVVSFNVGGFNLQVLNDKDQDIINVLRVIKGKSYKDFINLFVAQPCTKERFNKAMKHKANQYKGLSDIEAAVEQLITIKYSFNNNRKSFSKKEHGINVLWFSSCVRQIHDKLADIDIRCKDAFDIINEYRNNPNVFMFLDPPYQKCLRVAKDVYEYELDRYGHVNLLEIIRDAECKIMLCGYRAQQNDMYDEALLSNPKWHRFLLANPSKSSSSSTKKPVASEYIWVNYELPDIANKIVVTNRANEGYLSKSNDSVIMPSLPLSLCEEGCVADE